MDAGAWVSVLDEAEQSFTIDLPAGWRNRAWLVRRGRAVTPMATATRPDGGLALFTGDPSLPTFIEPGAALWPTEHVVQPPTSVEHLAPVWAQRRFGGLPGFAIRGMAPFPPLLRALEARMARAGGALTWATAGRLALSFDDPAGRVDAVALVATYGLAPLWFAEVHGVTASGDPEAGVAMLLHVVDSQRATPAASQRAAQERAASAAAHRATMAMIDQNTAILQANHRQNMANLQASAAAHQAHMASIHAAHDAAHEAWRDRQASDAAQHASAVHRVRDDEGHRRFLNAIAEESTVVDARGDVHQVPAGYDRYFYRASDGTFIGTRSHEDLRGRPGIDPSQFEEVAIKR